VDPQPARPTRSQSRLQIIGNEHPTTVDILIERNRTRKVEKSQQEAYHMD
jgi:hypothetical protein